MKLEDVKEKYNELSVQIIIKTKRKVELYKKLQQSNKLFRETKKVTLEPWEYLQIKSEIKIVEGELKILEEERKQLYTK